MKDLLGQLDPKTARTVVVVFVVMMLLITAIGFVGRSWITPIVLDKVFGVTDYVASQVNKEVDSGYTKTFVFKPGEMRPIPQVLYFYAKHDQDVTLIINGSSQIPQTISIKVDDVVVADKSGVHRTLPLKLNDRLDSWLTDETELGQDIHSLEVLPAEKSVRAPMVVDTLIIVQNKTTKS